MFSRDCTRTGTGVPGTEQGLHRDHGTAIPGMEQGLGLQSQLGRLGLSGTGHCNTQELHGMGAATPNHIEGLQSAIWDCV